MAAQDPAREFLDACAQIEQTLKARHRLEGVHGFGEVVRAVRDRDSVVRRYRDALSAFAELRNAISHHSYQGGLPIAVPLRTTVEAAKRVRQEIERPLSAGQVVTGTPMIASITDPLREVLGRMTEESFSQVPLYRGDEFAALLTTNAVARWVAANLDEDGIALLEGATAAAVLAFAEGHEVAEAVARTTPAATVLERLTSSSPPLAVLVTHNGRLSERPLGVLVAADVPRLLELMAVRVF